MAGRVIVGIRDEEAAAPPLRWALDYAAPRHLDVELVHVVDEGRGMLPRTVRGDALLAAEQQLRGMAEQARAQAPGLMVHPTVAIGSPGAELDARSAHATALFLGTRRAERFGHAIYSRRAARIAAHASCPVIVVPSEGDSGASGGRGVVVGVDNSPASTAAVAFAADEADRHGEPLTVVYAWRVPPPWTTELERLDWSMEPQEADYLVVAESVAGLAERFPDLEIVRDVSDRLPVDALVTVARTARLLVAGTHGRSELSRRFLGSISSDLLLAMPCPVAVVPPSRKDASA